jgi:hypothetical protein
MVDPNQADIRETDEVHRHAYNLAFEELGLSWHWDAATYARLPAPGRDGLRAYLQQEQSHLLRAYDADFLVHAIETAKVRCHLLVALNRAQAPWHGPSHRTSRAAQAAQAA